MRWLVVSKLQQLSQYGISRPLEILTETTCQELQPAPKRWDEMEATPQRDLENSGATEPWNIRKMEFSDSQGRLRSLRISSLYEPPISQAVQPSFLRTVLIQRQFPQRRVVGVTCPEYKATAHTAVQCNSQSEKSTKFSQNVGIRIHARSLAESDLPPPHQFEDLRCMLPETTFHTFCPASPCPINHRLVNWSRFWTGSGQNRLRSKNLLGECKQAADKRGVRSRQTRGIFHAARQGGSCIITCW